MTSFLQVETADFRDAARSMRFDAAEPLGRAVQSLTSALGGSGSMGGNDPAGGQWAHSYDRGARTAVQAGLDITNAGYRLAGMFDQSADNYESAEAASAARHPVPAADRRWPTDSQLYVPIDLPSARGGSGAGPVGWSLVAGSVGYVWPDGHQDRLHAAASAWHRAALALETRGDFAAIAAITLVRDRLPEAEDAVAVCNGLHAHACELAVVYRALGDSCMELARHIDSAHAEIVNELEWMAGESAVIQLGGAVLSAVSAGAAEGAAQTAQAARLKRAIDVIRGLLATFKAAVTALAARVAATADRAVGIARGVGQFLRETLYSAPVRTVGRFKREYHSELAALARLRSKSFGSKRFAFRDFVPPASSVDRHGILRSGRYFVNKATMSPHVRGKIGLALKSKFLRHVDADQAVLDAAAYADAHQLWKGTKAVVRIENGPVGIVGKSGRTTYWLTITRKRTGALHGWPSRGPHV